MILYSVRAIASGYLIAKFDEAFDVEATYEVSPSACTCPAFHRRQTCKHQDILAKFITRSKIDSEWFYCREADSWHNPLGLESMPRTEPAMKPYQVWVKQSGTFNMLFDSHNPVECKTYALENIHQGNNVERIEIRDLTGPVETIFDSGWIAAESSPRVEAPEGITILSLDNPADLHNTLADVFGEPRLEAESPPPTSPPLSVLRQVSSTFRRRI